MPSQSLARTRNLFALGILMLLVSSISIVRMRGLTLVDDAYIFMRYARNIARGDGFVWNPGEAPVEGFTSFLYTMLLASVEKLGLSQETVVPWLGLICTLAVMALTWRLARYVNAGRDALNLLAIALAGLSPSFVLWTTAGMEMTFYAALLATSIWSYLSFRAGKTPGWMVGFCFAVTTLARPETLALFVGTLGFELLRRRLQNKRIFEREVLLLAASFALIFVPFFAWRWHHFGYPFPNTYYAKTGAGLIQIKGGLLYLKNSVSYLFGGTAIVVLPLLAFIKWRGEAGWNRAYLAAIVFASWALVSLAGGDHFPGARFVMPALPLFFLLAVVGLGDAFERLPIKAAQAGLVALLLLAVFFRWAHTPPYRAVFARLQNAPVADNEWTRGFITMGQTLNKIGKPGDSIAAVPVGAIGYYSGMKVFDMVGLVDLKIAHQPFDPKYTATWRPGHDKGDGLYILSRRPRYIQLVDSLTSTPVAVPGRAMQYKSVVEIWNSPDFHRLYKFHPIKVEGGWYYNLYRRVG